MAYLQYTGSDSDFEETVRKKITDKKVPKGIQPRYRYNIGGKSDLGMLQSTDNLIVRGDNLHVMPVLESRYSEEIDFIYTDPPYNTGTDQFKYKDDFSQDSYLEFMEGRLQKMKKLLSDDGVISVHLSQHQYPYVKILMDQIFESYLSTFHIQVRHTERTLGAKKDYHDVIEYILMYSKTNIDFPKKKCKMSMDEYKYKIEEIAEPEKVMINGQEIEVFTPNKYKKKKTIPTKKNLKRISIRGTLKKNNSSGRYYVENLEQLEEDYPPRTIFKIPNKGNDSMEGRYFYTPPEGNKNGGYYQGVPKGKTHTKKPYPNYYDFVEEFTSMSSEGGTNFRNGKKPEELIKMLLEIFTDEGDLVLDPFLGSGSTAAVSHKMNRQYIGIEKQKYGDNDPTQRIKNVINGDSTGVSNEVNWSEGGSFVYLERTNI